MLQTRLFKHTFWLLFLVGAMNYVAVHLYLYWAIPWFDMVVHFSAGMCVAMASVLIYYFYTKQILPSIYTTLNIAIIGAIIIGVLWEIYELILHVTAVSDGLSYYLDTASDLLMDFSGGVLGAVYAYFLLPKNIPDATN